MKTPFFLSLLLIALCFDAVSQIVITQNDMPKVGDTIRRSNTALIEGSGYETAGANITWDFSDLAPGYQTIDTFVAVSSVPFLYQIVFNPNVANLASPVSLFDFLPGAPLSDIFVFYRKTTTLYGQAGVALTLSGLPIPMKYDNPEVFFRFPVTYTSKDSSVSNYSLALPDVGYYSTYRKRVNNVDAWGTVITPYGTFPCMRVKSNLITRDSVYIDSLSFGQALNRQYTEYKWMATGKGLPVMQVTEEGPLLTATYIDSVRLILGVENLTLHKKGFQLYPNPATEKVSIGFDQQQQGDVSIGLFDLSGRLVANLHQKKYPAGQHLTEINIKNLHLRPGIYLVKLTTNQHNYINKLVVR